MLNEAASKVGKLAYILESFHVLSEVQTVLRAEPDGLRYSAERCSEHVLRGLKWPVSANCDMPPTNQIHNVINVLKCMLDCGYRVAGYERGDYHHTHDTTGVRDRPQSIIALAPRMRIYASRGSVIGVDGLF